jgi:carotenoid biosynthesis protein
MTQLSPFLPHLFATLQNRPYVFAFLVFFLIFGTLQFGATRTFLFLVLGWAIAFASEASSIRNGFPYGDYQYVYEHLKGELLLWGVPLWDSLSYTFLAYASFSTASLLCFKKNEDFLETRTSWRVLFLTIVLMTGIDVIIDPLTALGDRWFLGKIYYYPHGGIYFGVPISNFLGWALVALAIAFCFQRLDILLHRKGSIVPAERWEGWKAWLGAALYLGVYFFNVSITVWLREWTLTLADLILVFPLLWALAIKYSRRSPPTPSRSPDERPETAHLS